MKTLSRDRDGAELSQRLRRLSADSVRRWGRMSAHQMICHLSDGLRMAIGQKPVSHSGTALQRTIVKWIALYAPLPWPAGIPTRPELDQELGGTGPVDFAADLAELETLLRRITSDRKSFGWPTSHPIFGRMSEADWLRWSYLHVDHHLRQFGA